MAASSSSSPIPQQSGYEVFLSFSGKDTRNSFTSHLFAALERHRFHTFKDDKRLEKGKHIASELLKAIEDSRIAIIVFSKKYTKSSWCLDELVKIMECQKTFQQIVLPIFYDVYPSEVRKQVESVTLKAKGSYEQVKQWIVSLTDAANLSGWDLQNAANRDEAKVIEEIIQDVGKKLNVTHLNVVDHPVGLDLRVQRLETLLSMESNDVRIVAVWGCGGVGKTTIAKELYNQVHKKFEGSSFLANIRENSKQPNDVVKLQEQLRSDLVKNYNFSIRNTDEGIDVLSRRAFYHRKVLLVLDDVDNDKQLKLLAINRSFFHPGSRIIITTRDKSSLNYLKVDELYEPKGLEDGESLELFNWHAFKADGQKEDFEQLSKQVVCYASGLPLALEILGSFLFRKGKLEWASAIVRLSKIPHHDIQGKLKLSFDTLTLDEQQLFLDIACFFVGMDLDFTYKILEGCKMYPVIRVRVLADHCLIKYDHNKFVMHDMIRDMGREIVRQESVREPGNRSRLWNHDNVIEVLKEGTGTEKVEGLFLNIFGPSFERFWDHKDAFEVTGKAIEIEKVEGRLLNFIKPKDVEVSAKVFKKMSRLRILHLNYVRFSTGYRHISSHISRRLVWLSWKGFPLTCMPSNWSMENLVALDLRLSCLKQVWSGTRILEKLKFLYLSHCRKLTTTPDFSGLRNLEELLLNGCVKLIEIHESISYLSKLVVLDVKNCKELKKLPSGIWMLNVKCLDFSGCSKLEELSLTSPTVDFVQSSSWLKRLIMPSCNLSHLPEAIGNLVSLEELDLIGNNLHTLPASIGNLTQLKFLDMRNCKVSHLPDEIGGLISLEVLFLDGNNLLSTLPEGIGNLTSLERLYVNDCNLSHLPIEIGKLISLKGLFIERNNLSTLPDSISRLTGLESLYVGSCNLSHLPCEIGSLISLKVFMLYGNKLCALPDSICNLTCLENLNVEDCNVSHLPEGIGNLIKLGSLSLGGNNFRILPDGFRNLPALQLLDLNKCPRLESLPELPVRACHISINNCPSLEDISFQSNWEGQPNLAFCGCQKLVENNFVDNFRRRLLQDKGLSELKVSINIVVPAMDGGVFPYWLEYKNTTGPDLSLVVPPPNVSQKILGFIICAVSTAAHLGLRYFIDNITNGSNHCCKVEVLNKNNTSYEDEMYLSYVPLCTLTGIQFESGDEILFHAKSHMVWPSVKQFGLSIIYKEDENSIAETSDQSSRTKKKKRKKTSDQSCRPYKKRRGQKIKTLWSCLFLRISLFSSKKRKKRFLPQRTNTQI